MIKDDIIRIGLPSCDEFPVNVLGFLKLDRIPLGWITGHSEKGTTIVESRLVDTTKSGFEGPLFTGGSPPYGRRVTPRRWTLHRFCSAHKISANEFWRTSVGRAGAART